MMYTMHHGSIESMPCTMLDSENWSAYQLDLQVNRVNRLPEKAPLVKSPPCTGWDLEHHQMGGFLKWGIPKVAG